MRTVLKTIFMLVLLAGGVMSGMITPNLTNPIQLTTKVGSGSQTFTVKFTLPSGPGLSSGQFLGLDLSHAGDNFGSVTANQMTCAVSSDDGMTFTFTSFDVLSGALFCQLTDSDAAKRLEPSKEYTLTVTFTIANRPLSLNNVGVFTATSNLANRIFIDNTVVFATVGNYSDYTTAVNNPLTFTNEVKITTGSINSNPAVNSFEPFIGDTFETKLLVSTNSRVSKDYDFILHFDTTYFSAPTGISTLAVSDTDPLKAALKGSLGLEVVSAGHIRITGIDETLIEKRQFYIVLSGWKALQKVVSSSHFHLMVFYRNTQTVFSYAQSSTALMVKQSTFEVKTMTSPDGYPYIASGMSWPVQISIKPLVTLNQAHVLVKVNYTGNSKYKFNAATCNFEGQTSDFGNTIVCHSYDNSTENGIHFYMPTLSNTSELKFTVWIHVSSCADVAVNSSNGTRSLNFQVEAYTDLTNANNGGAMASSKRIAASGPSSSQFKCSEAILSGAANDTSKKARKDLKSVAGTSESSSVVYLYALEINAIKLVNLNADFAQSAESSGLLNITFKSNQTGTEITKNFDKSPNFQAASSRIYLTDSTSFTSTESFLAISGDSAINQTNGYVKDIFPSTHLYSSAANSTVMTGYYMEVILRKKWFAAGKSQDLSQSNLAKEVNNLCWVGWSLSGDGNGKVNFTQEITNNSVDITNYTSSNVYDYVVDTLDPTASTTIWQGVNFLFQGKEKGTVDLAGSKLPSGSTPHWAIKGIQVTKTAENEAEYVFPSKENTATSGVARYLNFFTNCVTLKSDTSAMTVFDYFEVQLAYRSHTNGFYARLTRFISLNAMSGVFFNNTNTANDDPFILNLSVASYANEQNVCMAMMPGSYIKADVQVFVGFLSDVQLLDTDYTSKDNKYPIGNLKSGVSAYGFSTRIPTVKEGNIVAGNEYPTSQAKGMTALSAVTEALELRTNASQLWFTGITDASIIADTNNPSVIIPTYCYQSQTLSGRLQTNPVSLFTGFKGDKFNNVTGFSKHLFNGGSPVLPVDTGALNATYNRTTDHSYMYASFGKSSIVSDYTKSVYGTNTRPRATLLTSLIVMTTSDIIADDSLTPPTTTFSGLYSTAPTTFSGNVYFMGNKYSNFHITIPANPTSGPTFYEDTDDVDAVINTGTNLTIQNLKRPDLNLLVGSTGSINITNKVFIGIVASINGVSNRNITNSAVISGTQTSILGIANDSANFAWTVEFSSLDKNYEDNAAINMAVSSQSSAVIANNSPLYLTFGSNNISNSTICSISGAQGQYARACVRDAGFSTSGTSFRCNTTSSSANYNVCCFNAVIVTQSFILRDLAVVYSSSIPSNHLNTTLYNKSFAANYDGLTDEQEGNPTFTSVQYVDSKTTGGIGIAVLKIDLKKRLQPGNTIRVTGNFSTMSLYSANPSCTASVNSTGIITDNVNGDELISTCAVDFTSTPSAGTITVTTKSRVFLCSRTYAETIYVRLTPIKTVKLSEINFTTDILVNGQSVIPSSVKAAVKPVSSTVDLTRVEDGSTVTAQVQVVDTTSISHTLCNITSIFPNVVGASANYTFSINLSDVSETFSSDNRFPNEVRVFLPYSTFGDLTGTDLTCQSTLGGSLDCIFSRSVLTINFQGKDMRPSGTTSINVTIQNLKNTFTAVNELRFPCSLNRVQNNERTVLAYGRGQYTIAINNNSASTAGKFVFDKVQENSVLNPRGVSTMNLRLMVDKASDHGTSFSGTFDNSPAFLIDVAHSYPLAKYAPGQITVQITETRRNTDTSTYVLSTPVTIAEGKPTQFGNLLYVPLTSNVSGSTSSYSFTELIQWWDFNITGLNLPENEMVDAGITNIYLINNNNTLFFRTFDNTNNQFEGKINTSSLMNLNYYRGRRFTFDKKSWTINVSNATGGVNNRLTLQTGFYTQIKASILDYSNLEDITGEFTIGLSSNNISLVTKESAVKLYTSNDSVTFHLGVPCSTGPGRYVVNMEAVKPDNQTVGATFEKKIYVDVVRTINNITCNVPTIGLPRNTRINFSCTALETVDAWNLTFKNKDTADAVSTAAVTHTVKDTVLSAVFSTAFTDPQSTIASVTMVATSSNSCLNMGNNTNTGELTFNLDSQLTLPTITDADLEGISFKTVADDTGLAWNAISFSFTVPQFSTIYCALTCTNRTFPADITAQANLVASDRLGFFQQFSENSETVHTKTISGLRRFTNYKLKCTMTSNQSTGQRTQITKEWTQLNRAAETTTSIIKLPDTVTTKCLQFNLLKDMSSTAKQGLVNFCQNRYSANSSAGCMICTNITRQFVAVGTSIDVDTCPSSSALRSLQDEPTTPTTEPTEPTTEPTTPTTPAVTTTFSVCVVQNYLCATQLDTDTLATRFDSFKDSVDTKEKINNVINVSSRRLLAEEIELVSVETVEDKAVPEFKTCDAGVTEEGCYTATKNTWDFMGGYSFELTFNGSFNCKYAILEDSSTLPESSVIDSAPAAHSGSFTSANLVKTTLNNSATKQRFVRQKTFALYFYCSSRNVLQPRETNTKVYKTITETFPALEKNCPEPTLDVDPDRDDGCTCYKDTETKALVTQSDEGKYCTSSLLQLTLLVFIFVLLI